MGMVDTAAAALAITVPERVRGSRGLPRELRRSPCTPHTHAFTRARATITPHFSHSLYRLAHPRHAYMSVTPFTVPLTSSSQVHWPRKGHRHAPPRALTPPASRPPQRRHRRRQRRGGRQWRRHDSPRRRHRRCRRRHHRRRRRPLRRRVACGAPCARTPCPSRPPTHPNRLNPFPTPLPPSPCRPSLIPSPPIAHPASLTASVPAHRSQRRVGRGARRALSGALSRAQARFRGVGGAHRRVAAARERHTARGCAGGVAGPLGAVVARFGWPLGRRACGSRWASRAERA